MVIVQTAAVAINPTDVKMLDYSAASGAIHDYDFAGTIVALGKDVLASGRLAVGDRVAGFVHGMNNLQPDVDAFAEYAGACVDILLKLPDHMTFEEASTLGVGVGTAMMGFFDEFCVRPSLKELRRGGMKPVHDDAGEKERAYVLVAGGSIATGTRAIQLLKMLV